MNFILPDSFKIRGLNFLLLQEKQQHPERFIPDRNIISVYGSLYNTEADGGRVMQFMTHIALAEEIIKDYAKYNVQYSHVLSNEQIEDKYFTSDQLNKLLSLTNLYSNGAILTNLSFSNYIKENYPNIIRLGSVIRLDDLEYSCKLLDDNVFDSLVINPKYNYELSKVPYQYRNRMVVLTNDCCGAFCPNKKFCYEFTFANNVKYTIEKPKIGEYKMCIKDVAPCQDIQKSNRLANYQDPYDGHVLNFRELDGVIPLDKYNELVDLGFNTVKIEGRLTTVLSMAFLYVNLFVKEEYKEHELYNFLYWLHN